VSESLYIILSVILSDSLSILLKKTIGAIEPLTSIKTIFMCYILPLSITLIFGLTYTVAKDILEKQVIIRRKEREEDRIRKPE
jgi:hypothetical protein